MMIMLLFFILVIFFLMNPFFFNITFHILFNICCLICEKICGLIVSIFENCNNNRKQALRLFFNKFFYKVLRLRLSWFIRIVCDNYALQVLSVYAESAKEELPKPCFGLFDEMY